MNDSQFSKAVNNRAKEALRKMRSDAKLKIYVDDTLDMPAPYHGKSDIKLVIIGQDPTAGPKEKRMEICTVLKLNTEGPLKNFVVSICKGLGITLENVYATNVVKCFVKEKPTAIMRDDKVDVIALSAQYWIPILQYELDNFSNATVICLGEPILKVLVKNGYAMKVRHYWGWRPSWAKTGQTNPFSSIAHEACELNRTIYPFYHQPSERKKFYGEKKQEYLRFIKTRESGK